MSVRSMAADTRLSSQLSVPASVGPDVSVAAGFGSGGVGSTEPGDDAFFEHDAAARSNNSALSPPRFTVST